ncbi:MAG: hypothetical protein E7638_08340 [Ruminococcaceae bacterium]|nr:hypothetical protein [Oscillospiraceae bacterium]
MNESANIIFPTPSSTPRPIRLKETTRAWAWESLHGKYGDENIRNDTVSLDRIENFDSLSDLEKYDHIILETAKSAPLRICPHELICGSATLDGTRHLVPAKYKNEYVFYSISHLTIRYDKVIKEGLSSYTAEISHRLADSTLDEKQTVFLRSLENVIESIKVWHGRYLEATKDTRPDLHEMLTQVPFNPARNFKEALQSLWFIFAFVRLTGNWPGIGRIDRMLGDYLRKDLAEGTITRDEAREYMASFFIKGCEWILSDTPPASGDAQHYQNIVLAGVDEDGVEVTNEVTYLCLDVVEELGISDYPITVRLNKNTSHELKRRMAEVIRHGGGIVAAYNEDLILRALRNLGYPEKEARAFANDGCWEVQIPGKTHFEYFPFDGLQILNECIGITADDIPECDSIEDVYALFLNGLRARIGDMHHGYVENRYIFTGSRWESGRTPTPASVVSLFEDGCIDKAQSYLDCGPCYIVRSPHLGGAPDVANSLYAIEQLVYKEKKISFSQLVKLLRNNWEGGEELCAYVKNKYVYYGNDCDEADRWHSRVLDDFADIVMSFRSECPVKFIPGISTFGRQIEWAPNRAATAFGYKKGEILSGNDSPVPGTDAGGATAIIKSYCKADLVKQASGAALDIKLLPESIKGEAGITAIVGLLDGFCALGGFFMQIDTVDTATLLDAQKNPEKHKTLAVRVSGWSARFVTLNEEWQRMIIERSGQGV